MSKKYPDEEVYNKLVRDRIPEIIERDGKVSETRILSKEELIPLLGEKLDEEVRELLEVLGTDREETIKEMSDVLEVLRSLAEEQSMEMSEIEEVMEERAEKRGRFKQGIFLEKTRKNE
ncbi:MAG: nucleoside triphosphate pyrophosphohydrolase [Patescibacteria group bacterium]